MEDFFNNYLIIVGGTAWLTAQLIKTILVLIMTKELNLERLFGSGGMPSAHSALVCSLTVGAGKSLGVSSPLFAIMMFMAFIVMYDATGVRRQAGEHAKALNNLLREMPDHITSILEKSKKQENREYFKELIGHTPLEVICGAVLGIIVAVVIPVF